MDAIAHTRDSKAEEKFLKIIRDIEEETHLNGIHLLKVTCTMLCYYQKLHFSEIKDFLIEFLYSFKVHLKKIKKVLH